MIVQSAFVLILQVASYGPTSTSIATAEFMGEPACKQALAAFREVSKREVVGVCVPKMVVPSDAK